MTRNNFQHQRNALSRLNRYPADTMSISDKKGLNFDRNKTILTIPFDSNDG